MFELTQSTYERFKKNHGFVYLVHAEGTARYKIGRSQNPKERLVQLQGQSPYKLVLKKAWWTPDCFRTEQKLHEAFADYRVYGEWFEFSDPIDEDIIFRVDFHMPEVFDLALETALSFCRALYSSATNYCSLEMSPKYISAIAVQDAISNCKTFNDFLNLLEVFCLLEYYATDFATRRSQQDKVLYFKSEDDAAMYAEDFVSILSSTILSFEISKGTSGRDRYRWLYEKGGDR